MIWDAVIFTFPIKKWSPIYIHKSCVLKQFKAGDHIAHEALQIGKES